MLSFRPHCESVCVQTQFAQHSACVKYADFASVVQIFTVQKKKKDFFLFVFEVQVWNAAFANWEVLGNMCNKALV